MNINLAVGKYNITASYAGSSLYGGSSVTNLVEVLSTISANDVVKFYRMVLNIMQNLLMEMETH